MIRTSRTILTLAIRMFVIFLVQGRNVIVVPVVVGVLAFLVVVVATNSNSNSTTTTTTTAGSEDARCFVQEHRGKVGQSFGHSGGWIVLFQHPFPTCEQFFQQQGTLRSDIVCRQRGCGLTCRFRLLGQPLETSTKHQQGQYGCQCERKDNETEQNAVPLRGGHVGQSERFQQIVHRTETGHNFGGRFAQLFQVIDIVAGSVVSHGGDKQPTLAGTGTRRRECGVRRRSRAMRTGMEDSNNHHPLVVVATY